MAKFNLTTARIKDYTCDAGKIQSFLWAITAPGLALRAPPKNKMHLSKKGKQLQYATLAGDKREDCKNWIGYLAKSRSNCPDIKQTYFSSRNTPRQRNAPAEVMHQ